MPLCTCWNQNPSKCTNYFQVFLKKLAIPCTYLFFKHVPRSFAPKQRRHFEIFRNGDGLSLVHLLEIKSRYAKIIGKDVE